MKKRKKKISVHILGASRSRGIYDALQDKLKDCKVQGTVKPGAKLEALTDAILKSCEMFAQDDHVIVFGGSSDIYTIETFL